VKWGFEGALPCEVALLRHIIMSKLTTRRMEISDDDYSTYNIKTNDAFIDAFDLINKFRAVRIS
jgi:hypothetical protein